MSILDETKSKMEAAKEHFTKELRNLRTNRANPGMLDGVMVECYGTAMRLKDLASVSVPESRQLLVSPFDAQTSGAIGKAIETTLNLQAIVEGNQVRIPIPALNEDVRKDIVKQAKKKAEEARIAIREIRRKSNETVRKQKNDGEIPEDIMKKSEKQIQEQTDKYCKDIDQLLSDKEKDILEV